MHCGIIGVRPGGRNYAELVALAAEVRNRNVLVKRVRVVLVEHDSNSEM